jgi:glyoxylase-like metal-dependent hydrolase (beta-lactamase superfamily II)
METILGDVLTWSWFSEPHGYNFNGLLIPSPDGNICIDPIEPDEAVLSELVRLGVSRILLTNRNHVRAANKVRERTGASCYIHPEDAAYAKGQGAIIDGELHEGERIGPLEVIGVSGKSPGEVAFLWPVEPATRTRDGRSGASAPQRPSIARTRLRHNPGRRRRLDNRGRKAAPARLGQQL